MLAWFINRLGAATSSELRTPVREGDSRDYCPDTLFQLTLFQLTLFQLTLFQDTLFQDTLFQETLLQLACEQLVPDGSV